MTNRPEPDAFQMTTQSVASNESGAVIEFGRGSTQDAVTDLRTDWSLATAPYKPNTLRFLAGVKPEDVLVSLPSVSQFSDVLYRIAGTADTIRVQSYGDWVYEFAETGQTLSLEELLVQGGVNEVDGTEGDDRFKMTPSRDVFHGLGGRDYLVEEGNYTVIRRDVHDYFDGGAGDDVITSMAGNDTLIGGPGDDFITGNWANYLVVGGTGNDTIRVLSGDNVMLFSAGFGLDSISAGQARLVFDDTLPRSTLQVVDRRFDSFAGVKRELRIGTSGDRLLLEPSDRISLEFADGTKLSHEAINAWLTTGTDGNDSMIAQHEEKLDGGAGDDLLEAGFSATLVLGGLGNDTLNAGPYSRDTLLGGDGEDVLRSMHNSALMWGGRGSDQYVLGGYGSGLRIGASADPEAGIDQAEDLIDLTATLGMYPGVATAELVPHGAFHDLSYAVKTGTYSVVQQYSATIENVDDPQGPRYRFKLANEVFDLAGFLARFGAPRVGSEDPDQLVGNQSPDTIHGGGGNDSLFGDYGKDSLYGEGGDDTLVGGQDEDWLDGGAGDDFLDGRDSGMERLLGGAGQDTLVSDANGWFDGGEGSDTYVVTARLLYKGTVIADSGGSQDTDVLILNPLWPEPELVMRKSGNDLKVQLGAQTAVTVVGQFNPDAPGPRVERIELYGGKSLTWADIDRAILQGTGANDSIEGTRSGDRIEGGDGQDWIDGLTGFDTILAGNGDDLVIGHGLLLGGAGDDSVYGTVWRHADVDTLDGGLGQDHLESVWSTAVLQGGAGRDVLVSGLYGHAGDQTTLDGGAGFDTFVVRGPGALILQSADEAPGDVDRVMLVGINEFDACRPDQVTLRRTAEGVSIDIQTASGLSKALIMDPDGMRAFEVAFEDGTVWSAEQVQQATLRPTEGNDTLVGSGRDELIIGGGGDDVLQGLQGRDTLEGGEGADTYIFAVGDGHDLVHADASDTIRFGAGRGRAKDLRVQYDATVPDALVLQTFGDTQDDVFIPRISELADLTVAFFDGSSLTGAGLIEIASGGGRMIRGTPLTDVLEDGPLNDTLLGGDGNDQLTSKVGSDLLLGGRGDDTLSGRGGRRPDSDTLVGGEGDDLLFTLSLDGALVVCRFEAGFGHDIMSPMGRGNIVEFGSSIQPGDLRLQYLEGEVSLLRSGSADQLDIQRYFSDLDATSITFADGTIWGRQQVVDRLSMGTVGNDSLYGTGFSPALEGGAGDDLLSEGTSGPVDLMGGDGRDTLWGASQGGLLDGGSGDDLIAGEMGPDLLCGGPGHDTLTGAAGADTYQFKRGDGEDLIHADAQDTIVLGEGITRADLNIGQLGAIAAGAVQLGLGSTDSITLDNAGQWGGLLLKFADGSSLTGTQIMLEASKPVEPPKPVNLTLTGTAGKDLLTGKAGDDTLTGLAGNDTLAGATGNDKLIGGKGADTYLFNRGDGQDTIVDNDTSLLSNLLSPDLLKLDSAKSNQLWLTKAGNNLDIAIIGTKDKVTIQDWYKGSANQVEKITALGDNKSLSASKVNALVTAMAKFTAPAEGVTTLPAATQSGLTKILASSWA